MRDNINLQISQCRQAMSVIDQCSDDYIFVYDLVHDFYSISEKAVNVFALKGHEIHNAVKNLEKIVFKQDWLKLREDFERIRSGNQEVHDLEFRLLCKNGKYVWISSRAKVLYDSDQRPAYLIGRIAEIGKQNKYDNITGLYCENVLEQDYNLLQTGAQNPGFVLLVGVDNFKEINEKYGYNVGNDVLSRIAECILHCSDEKKYVFRLKGDEFAILGLTQSSNCYDVAKKLYKRIRHCVDSSIEKSGYHIFYTVSGGAATFDTKRDSFDQIMRNARFALHSAKICGKNIFVPYSEEKYFHYIKKLDIQEHLRNCIENDFQGFEVYYQPIINPNLNRISGAEALIRWESEKYGFMSPVDFVPLLEESALIIPLGKWIIEKAVKQCKEWLSFIPDFVMNINLSFIQIIKSDILKDTFEFIDRYEIDHRHIVFEITESGELESNRAVRNVLRSFSNRGIRLAIDDFGTGYSNLRYIRDMMFGIIKIDRIFVRNIHSSEDNYMLVKYVVDMAHKLNILVCIEGVETQDELEKVMSLHPDCIQGFYYGKPMKSSVFAAEYIAMTA